MRVALEHPQTRVIKEVKVGFSWTTLIFGFFPALFRGDWKWALIIAGVGVLLSVMSLGLAGWIAQIGFAFVYNKLYFDDLLNAGYEVTTKHGQSLLQGKGWLK